MSVREHPLMKAAASLADLGSPFYREERQREVWNEASAVGLQFLLWTGYGLATAMAWFGGAAVLPWTIALIILVGAGSVVTVWYAGSLGVSGLDVVQHARTRCPRIGDSTHALPVIDVGPWVAETS